MKSRLTLLFVLVLSSAASAHTGHGGHGATDGLLHPLQGLDHLLAMVAVGVWAAMDKSGRRVWLLPAAFVSMLLVGLAVGRMAGEFAATEWIVAASVIAVGVLIATRTALPTTLAGIIAGAFALFHGTAHGAEIPTDASAWQFAAGMVIATAALHIAGVAIGLGLRNTRRSTWLRLSGAGVACCGLLIALGIL